MVQLSSTVVCGLLLCYTWCSLLDSSCSGLYSHIYSLDVLLFSFFFLCAQASLHLSFLLLICFILPTEAATLILFSAHLSYSLMNSICSFLAVLPLIPLFPSPFLSLPLQPSTDINLLLMDPNYSVHSSRVTLDPHCSRVWQDGHQRGITVITVQIYLRLFSQLNSFHLLWTKVNNHPLFCCPGL